MPWQDQHVLGNHREQNETEAHREESEATIEMRQEELATRKQAVEAGRVGLGT